MCFFIIILNPIISNRLSPKAHEGLSLSTRNNQLVSERQNILRFVYPKTNSRNWIPFVSPSKTFLTGRVIICFITSLWRTVPRSCPWPSVWSRGGRRSRRWRSRSAPSRTGPGYWAWPRPGGGRSAPAGGGSCTQSAGWSRSSIGEKRNFAINNYPAKIFSWLIS